MQDYYILKGKENMKLDDVKLLLEQTYWAKKPLPGNNKKIYG